MDAYRALHTRSLGTLKLVTRNIASGQLEAGLAWEILDVVASGFSDQIHFTVVVD